jgi:MFS family permease
MLAATIVLWGVAMLWSATVSSFGELLLARLFLGAVTAAAGPVTASLVGDWFAPSERGRIYAYITSGELIGAAIGFGVTGGIATLSWRAAFVILALPAFFLAWLVFQLREPARGGRTPLLSATAATAETEGEDGDREHVTDAQHLARERGIAPDPALVLRKDPRRMSLVAATRYVFAIKTNVALILASGQREDEGGRGQGEEGESTDQLPAASQHGHLAPGGRVLGRARASHQPPPPIKGSRIGSRMGWQLSIAFDTRGDSRS